jgi:drug/metabolite transporter (DMT)-like permease
MKNFLLLCFIIFATSLTPIFAKVSVAEISPLSLGFIRFGAAAVLFYITLKLSKGNLKFDKKDYIKLSLLGIICIPVNQYFFLTGIKNSFASHSGIIYSLNPVFAYCIAVIRKDEKFYKSKLFAILLTVIGIIFVFYESIRLSSSTQSTIYGDSLLIIAVLSFSLYITLGKKYIDKYGPLKVTTYVFLTGTVFNLPVFIYDFHNLTFEKLTFPGIFGIFYLTIIVSYGAYFTWYYALKSNKVSLLTTLSNVSPVLTVLFSILFLSEYISIFFLIGGLLTVIGVFTMHKVSIELN